MNAGESVHSVARMRALASTITLVRRQFPAAQANLSPWRDDPQTRKWSETESLDLSFHFPGWSPRLECRSLLMQLRISAERGDDGLRFYVFDDIADEKAFKTNYRAAMDSLPIDQATADRIVEEANHAFHLNMNMFKELEGNLVAAIGKVLFGFLTRRQRAGSTEAAAA